MTVREERVLDVPAPPAVLWDAIADPELRARAISVVSRYEPDDPEGREATWYLELPIPLLGRLIPVHTEDRVRDPPNRVEFVGRSKVMRVRGEHVVEPTETGSRVTNRFVVDGKVPGVETFFSRNLDREIENLADAVRERVAADPRMQDGGGDDGNGASGDADRVADDGEDENTGGGR